MCFLLPRKHDIPFQPVMGQIDHIDTVRHIQHGIHIAVIFQNRMLQLLIVEGERFRRPQRRILRPADVLKRKKDMMKLPLRIKVHGNDDETA